MQIVITSIKGGTGKSTIVAALSQILDADIIDHDKYGSLTATSKHSGINKPVLPKDVKKNIAIHDTPPYVGKILRAIIKIADLIIIPCRLSYADLMSLNIIAEELRRYDLCDKSIIVFNGVKKPISRVKKSILENFKANFRDIKKASTILSESDQMATIFSKKIEGQAKEETQELIQELRKKGRIK